MYNHSHFHFGDKILHHVTYNLEGLRMRTMIMVYSKNCIENYA